MNTVPLFEPLTLGDLTLSNRVVMAPMTRKLSPNHIPGLATAEYYGRRAEDGVGLIITEGTAINHPASHAYPDVPNLYGEKALEGWRQVVDKVHLVGGKIMSQLWHVGSVRQLLYLDDDHAQCCDCTDTNIPAYGPSAIVHPYVANAKQPEALTLDDIDKIIQAFAQAARDSQCIGFDGIELHGAHGYLIDQFFWEKTNQRTDHYGGATLAERAQFAVDVIVAVREAVGKNYTISFRMSQWKLGDYDAKMASTPKELESLVIRLAEAGVDIFHCSSRRFFEPEFPQSPLNLAGWVKKLIAKPTITVGSVGLDDDFISSLRHDKATSPAKHTIDDLNERLARNEFDLVAVGRMLLSNPDWVSIVRNGQFDKLVPFTKSCLDKLY